MSNYKFFGSWFYRYENKIDLSDTGDGTYYPFSWDRTDGQTTVDQICRFEVGARKVRNIASGSVTLNLKDPTGGGNPDELHTVIFSFDSTDDPRPGTYWSINEPADLLQGGFAWSTHDQVIVNETTAWGMEPVTITVDMVVGGDTPTASALGTTDWPDCTTYWKGLHLLVSGEAQHGTPFASNIFASTAKAVIGGTPTASGISANIFHGTAQFWYNRSDAANAFAVSAWDVTVDQEYDPPPDI